MLQLRYTVLSNKFASEEELEKIEKENQQIIFDAADKAEAAPDADGSKYYELFYRYLM